MILLDVSIEGSFLYKTLTNACWLLLLFGLDVGYMFSQLYWRYLVRVSHFSEKRQDNNSFYNTLWNLFWFQVICSKMQNKVTGVISKRMFRVIYHTISLSPRKVFNVFIIVFIAIIFLWWSIVYIYCKICRIQFSINIMLVSIIIIYRR